MKKSLPSLNVLAIPSGPNFFPTAAGLAQVTWQSMSSALGPAYHLWPAAPHPPAGLPLTRDGARCGVAVDLLAPNQLLIQIDHLGEVVIGLQDLRCKAGREGDVGGGFWGETSTPSSPACVRGEAATPVSS